MMYQQKEIGLINIIYWSLCIWITNFCPCSIVLLSLSLKIKEKFAMAENNTESIELRIVNKLHPFTSVSIAADLLISMSDSQ